MTTQVKVTITQAHNPVRISSVNKEGHKVPLVGLSEVGDSGLFYVYDDLSVIVEEVNVKEEGTDGG
jgi:hypothetical protein